MQRIVLTLFSCSLLFALNSLQAQEADSEIAAEPNDQTVLEQAVDTVTETAKDSRVPAGPERRCC